MECILDIQGFYSSSNDFIAKEISILYIPYNGMRVNDVETLTFKPPHPWTWLAEKTRETNKFTIKRLHGLPWALGDFEYTELLGRLILLFRDISVVYLKGDLKKKWLQSVIGEDTKEIIDIACLGCPSIYTLSGGSTTLCKHENHHLSSKHALCSLDNVFKLQLWMDEHIKTNSSPLRSVKLLSQLDNIGMMKQEDVEMLPKEVLLSHMSRSIGFVWFSLPASLRKDPELFSYTRCDKGHGCYGKTEGGNYDVPDGPPPRMRNCDDCMKSYTLPKVYKK